MVVIALVLGAIFAAAGNFLILAGVFLLLAVTAVVASFFATGRLSEESFVDLLKAVIRATGNLGRGGDEEPERILMEGMEDESGVVTGEKLRELPPASTQPVSSAAGPQDAGDDDTPDD
jgi:hypothetical protein